MKFQLDSAPGRHLFTGYGPGYLEINRERHASALVVTAESLHTRWPARWDDLAEEHFAFLLTLNPEIVLLGSGTRQRFPHPRLLAGLAAARIGCEAMDTAAACRTYNILIAEGRNALAAVMPLDLPA